MNKAKSAQVLIHKFKSSSGKTKFHYQWVGPIDGVLYVDFNFLDSDSMRKIPFRLKRMRNLPDGKTAVFLRVDWLAQIVRFFRFCRRLIHE